MAVTTQHRTVRGPHRTAQGALIGLGCAFLVLGLYFGGTLERLELTTLDWRFQLRPEAVVAPPDDFAIVTIDQPSIEEVYRTIGYRWPWPRLFYGKIIEFLQYAGARAIVFDVFFSEPDIERDISGAESDAMLVRATHTAGNVIHTYVLRGDGLPPDPAELGALRTAPQPLPDPPPGVSLPTYATAALPSPELTAAAGAMGFANITPDHDNVARRLQTGSRLQDGLLPSMALTTHWHLAGRPVITWTTDRLTVGGQAHPLRPDGSAYLWWYGTPEQATAPFPTIPAVRVMRAQTERELGEALSLDPELFKDRVVYLGSTAPGLFDIKAIPLAHAVPGVIVQATAAANLKYGHTVTRTRAPLVVTLTACFCLICATLARGVRNALPGTLATLAFLLATAGIGWALLAYRHVFLDIVPISLGPLAAFGATTLVNYLTERQHARLVRDIFEHYLDSAVVKTLINDPNRVRLGGERREVTALYSDVADFTSTSERMEPEQLVHFMNRYLDAMTQIIIEEGGFVDKFVGDEIVAIFGAPGELPDHAARACRAVMRMTERMQEMQDEFRDLGCTHEVFFRAGISTGPLVVGNMGSERRMNYTAMGDVMNLGARLESANKQYATRVLVSEDTAVSTRTLFRYRQVDRVRVKGKQQGVSIYELRGSVETAPEDAAFAQAFKRYQAGQFTDAAAAFETLADAGDSTAAILAARCRDYQTTPPPADWDGVHILTTK